MEAIVAATGGNKSTRLYFILFWMACVVLAMNIVVAFCIEAYSIQKKQRTESDRLARTAAASAAARALATSGGAPAAPASSSPDEEGVDNWKALVLGSGVDFSSYTLTRARFHADVHDLMYAGQIKSAHSIVFQSAR
jgi:hypothetical protein